MFICLRLIVSVFFLIPTVLSASNAANKPNEKVDQLILKNTDKKASLRVEIKQGNLRQVLKAIETQTGVKLHYSYLPQKSVTANCSGSTPEVLKCLLGEDVNLMYRYSRNSSEAAASNQLSEIWILDTVPEENRMLISQENTGVCDANKDHKKQTNTNEHEVTLGQNVQVGQEEITRLLKLSQSKDPNFRKEALSRLATVGHMGDKTISDVFELGLTDENPNVRAQAVAGLAQKEGAEIESMLRESMYDDDAGVRLMAVDNAGNNISLLEMAITDDDETVRQLAEMKLEQLLK